MKIGMIRIGLMCIAGGVLTFMQLPAPIALARPLWILLFVIYWQLLLSVRFSVSVLVVFGLLMDVLCSSIMGLHALALIVPSACLLSRSRRFTFFLMPQQMLWIMVLSFLYQVTLAIAAYSTGYSYGLVEIGLPVLTSTLVWPTLKHVLDYAFRRVRV